MADIVTSQVLADGSKTTVMKFTNLSAGVGESAVLKVNVGALAPPATIVDIQEIWYSVFGMVVTLLWQANVNVRILELRGDGHMDLSAFGGIKNNAGAGVTGNILLTTTGHAVGSSYSIILRMRKS
ncbi:MAG: hypothetical protein DDT19_00861 [Syntrophomonadaceae bacterium]|nr:hypothetical protein [Bacillota bacterium]